MKFVIDIEKISQSKTHVVIPAMAFDDEGNELFESLRPVPIKKKLFDDLRSPDNGGDKINEMTGNPQWLDDVRGIVAGRLRSVMAKQGEAESLSISDKRAMIGKEFDL